MTIYKWTSIGRHHKLMNPMDMVEAYMLSVPMGRRRSSAAPAHRCVLFFFLFIVFLLSHHLNVYEFSPKN
jgi:hypothetical protein